MLFLFYRTDTVKTENTQYCTHYFAVANQANIGSITWDRLSGEIVWLFV